MANVRASLRHEGVAYYKSDLEVIAKKECTLNKLRFVSYTVDRKTMHLRVVGTDNNNNGHPRAINIPFNALHNYRVGKIFENQGKTVNYLGVFYDAQKLMAIGREVASMWGGECLSYSLDLNNKEIIYSCIEHGEDFVTTIAFAELQSYK